jgi:hypothetical protein
MFVISKKKIIPQGKESIGNLQPSLWILNFVISISVDENYN